MKTLRKVEVKAVLVDGTIPEVLEPNTIYYSEEYQCAIHLCLCGCGNQAVTPIRPGEWDIDFTTKAKISMTPSILNRFCGSHYIITNSIANFV